ncbi:uncharacterized protein LAESUDRAFT_738030 [Laetiporus sulphureus 93-53]|uniref:Low temperature viability protein n=1 Tax=Laetiporus sulphureus 93-53 TaxID=1314785 RepID=A0A165D392_9APHY|nr:uncharacterized protein LAESUDRAFT_738030 [Laetiporus sulphureus 93-53]KZT04072.1 hypothetical protein LAESUDRAFT_738030 [Laetiporus sulphureus 93-53]
MPTKSIFQEPGVRHFQLIHRSQRDSLIHDPEVSQHVLKAFERGNVVKGKSRAELEQILSPSDLTHDTERKNIGEAALYSVYYDDTVYNYMQHLCPVGMQEDGFDSILIEAPSKAKEKAKEPITLIDLPPEVLPSTSEVPCNYEFNPELDPHLCQVLQALKDDAFVDDDLDDDFFRELVADGKLASDGHLEFEFRDEGIEDGHDEADARDEANSDLDDAERTGWEARFTHAGSDMDASSKGGDTIGALPQISVIGGKKRQKGTSDASGYSMSSLSMFRNEGLTLIDEQFDNIQREYNSEENEETHTLFDDSDEASELITSREDFDAMMNEFLENYEIFGGKMSLGGVRLREENEEDEEDDILMPHDIDEKKDQWDCETILSTYSNLENHPRLIRARQDRPVPKIPSPKNSKYAPRCRTDCSDSLESDSDDDIQSQRVTISQPKNESKEDKQTQKQAIKAERQLRRTDKKAMKEQFSTEVKRQNRVLLNKKNK